MKYKLIVDCGKPYEIRVNGDRELEEELLKLKRIALKEIHAHFDVLVLNEINEDITESQFIQEILN